MAPAATNEKKGLHGAGKENKRASTATTAVSPSPIPDDDSQESTSAWLCDEGNQALLHRVHSIAYPILR